MNKVEQKILELIQKGDLKPYDQLLNETLLIKKYKASKMTVRDAIKTLLNKGILISVPRQYVYVSPYWKDLVKGNNSFEFTYSKSKVFTSKGLSVPNDIKKYLKYDFNSNDYITFVKIYYNDKNEIIAFSSNWINKKYSAKAGIKEDADILFKSGTHKTAFNKIIMMPTNNMESVFLSEPEGTWMPTIFSLSTKDGDQHPTYFRLYKVKPYYFKAFNFKRFD